VGVFFLFSSVCVWSCFCLFYGFVSDARRKASASEIPPSLPFDTAMARAKLARVRIR